MDRDDAASGTPADGPSTSGFQFNLDAALNELRRSRPPTLADLVRVGQDDHEPSGEAAGADDLPEIHEATSVDDPPRPASGASTSWSATASRSAPSTAAAATGTTITPASTPVVASQPVSAPSLPSISPIASIPAGATASTSGSPAGTVTATMGAVAVIDAPPAPVVPSIPSVPAYVAVPPPINPALTATPPFVAAAQRSGATKRRKRRAGVRAFMLLVVMGAAVAGALVYGRAYLFPDEWERDLVPIADDIEATAGVEFVDAVRVDELPVEDYDARAATALFGAGWDSDVARWRALGLASGEATPATFGPVLRSWSPAVYDPATGEVLRIDTLGGKGLEAALTEQLTAVLFDQVYDANLLVDPSNPMLSRAVVAHQIELTADGSTTATESTLDRAQLDALPSPLAFELLARADLGVAAAAAADLTLAEDDPSALGELQSAVTDVLGAPPQAGSTARLLTGDVVAGDPTVPTRDFWYLVFGAYLPADAAAAGSDAISRASLTPATRAQTACAYATLTGIDAAAAGVIQFVVNAWVQAAPAESQASTTTFDDGTIQLVTCDPGTAPGVRPRTGVAAELVAREVALLAG